MARAIALVFSTAPSLLALRRRSTTPAPGRLAFGLTIAPAQERARLSPDAGQARQRAESLPCLGASTGPLGSRGRATESGALCCVGRWVVRQVTGVVGVAAGQGPRYGFPRGNLGRCVYASSLFELG